MNPIVAPLYTLTAIADGALTGARFVTVEGARPDTLGQKVLGVARYAVADKAAATVDVLGTVLVEAGGAIAIDDDITTDDQGRAVAVTDTATQRTNARALTAASGAGKQVLALLLPR